MAVFLKNISNDVLVVRGREIASGSYLEVPEAERISWYEDNTVFINIASEILQVSKSDDGLNDISDKTQQWKYLGNLIPPSISLEMGQKVLVDKGMESFTTLVTHDWTDENSWSDTDNSEYILEPSSSTKKLLLTRAEVQFSHDVKLGSQSTPGELYFDIWVYNPLFDPNSSIDADDPAFVPGVSSGNPLRFLYQRNVYSSIRDVFNYGNEHFTCPVDGIDGIPLGITTVQFNYDQIIPLRGDQGAQVRFSLKNHAPMDGSFCTISCIVREEDL